MLANAFVSQQDAFAGQRRYGTIRQYSSNQNCLVVMHEGLPPACLACNEGLMSGKMHLKRGYICAVHVT